jgi:hypothetical protein
MSLSFSSIPVDPSKQPSFTPFGGLIMRVYWMIMGHLLVAMLGVAIFMNQIHYRLLLNLLYLVAAVLCIVARFIDIKYYKGQTSDGEPSTMKHWRRYSIFVAAYAVPLWIAIQIFARMAR